MFCIIAFIVFLLLYPILGIFSPDYRYLFRKSFSCVFKKVTMKPCDIDLKTEIKGKLIGKTLAKYPKFIKFFDKSFDILAFVFVALSVWSLIYSLVAGLNLFVYDTCTPASGESCSLSGEACGVSSGAPTFKQAVDEGRLGEWAVSPVTELSKTISLIPNRLKEWKGEDYASSNATYYSYREGRPVALEVIDPGCKFCKQLYQNIKKTDFTERYNLTYIAYPIPDSNTSSGYKFQHSYLMASYLEAVKDIKPSQQPSSNLTPDWFLVDAFFTRPGTTASTLQDDFNLIFSEQQAKDKLSDLLKEYGYSDAEIQQIAQKAQSQEVRDRLTEHKETVEKEINTIRIPTIMFDGRRYDRVIDEKKLSK